MYFQSVGFLFLFLPVALLVTHGFPSTRYRTIALLIVSYLFYSGAEPFFLLILAFSSLVDFFVADHIAKSVNHTVKKCWLSLSLLVNLALLAFFKYGALILRALTNSSDVLRQLLPDPIVFEAFILPPGISFYTFQSLSYSLDVYRGVTQPTRDLWGFLAYIAYLPQLIAGPIERFQQLYPQLQAFFQRQQHPQWSAGVYRLTVGIAQKLLLADSCGRIVDVYVTWNGTYSFTVGWLTALAFGMQIYYDFAGYSNMAIGVSLLFGVRLSENFLSPYKARNIQDFWRRWHVTLSSWFRDYLYIPLGGSRGSTLRTALNLLITFILCGLWHGAGVNFVVWGFGHGLLLAGFRISSHWFPRWCLPSALAVCLTFLCVNFLWVVFRVADAYTALNLWRGMLGLSHLGLREAPLWDSLFLSGVIAGTWLFPNCAQLAQGKINPVTTVLLVGLAMFALLTSPQIHQFIYFQF